MVPFIDWVSPPGLGGWFPFLTWFPFFFVGFKSLVLVLMFLGLNVGMILPDSSSFRNYWVGGTI